METLKVVLSNVGMVAGATLGWFAQVNTFDGLIPMLLGRMNLKAETVKPETSLAPVLVGRILTAILVGEGSPVVHAVVKKARDLLVGVFEA
jgi:hypothetical protein